jgi:excisionase family DNA binding protein
MKKTQKSSDRTYLTTGQVAYHCQVSIPALKRWIQDGQLSAFKTPGGHCRIELKELQQFLHRYGMPPYPTLDPAIRILIVDDEPSVVDLFVHLLADDPRGFTLDTAIDGYEALIKVGTFQPSLLILDALMPHLDGVEVCRRLKAAPDTCAMRILGITGHPDMVFALMEAGADACLTKPLDLRLVQKELQRLLASVEASR